MDVHFKERWLCLMGFSKCVFRLRRGLQMKTGRKIAMMVFAVFAASALIQTTALRSRGQDTSMPPSQKVQDTDDAPIADYAASNVVADSPQDASRKEKGKLYDRQGIVRDRDTGGKPIVTFSHWDQWVPAIPAAKSSLIVTGEVVNAHAYLSNDRTGIYSEFTLRVEEVFKDNSGASVVPGGVVSMEREGGRVKFPSGRVVRYITAGRGMPRKGRSYIFFLELTEQRYSILTAYELRGGRVYPIDGEAAPEGRRWAGDVYKGIDAMQFLNEVRTSIAQSPTASEEGALK